MKVVRGASDLQQGVSDEGQHGLRLLLQVKVLLLRPVSFYFLYNLHLTARVFLPNLLLLLLLSAGEFLSVDQADYS